MPQNIYDEALQERAGSPSQPTENIYERAFRERAGGDEQQLRATLIDASTRAPETAAKAAQLAQRTGLPVSVVESNLEAIERRAQIDETEYARLVRQAPKLSSWLTANPTHAAVAQPEIPQFETIERRLTFLESLRRGVDVTHGMLFGAVEATGELLGLEGAADFGRSGRLQSETAIAGGPSRSSVTEIRDFADVAQWVKETVGEQIPIMAPLIGGAVAGAAIGSVAPGVGTTIGAIAGAFVPGLVMGVGEVQGAIKERGADAKAPAAAFIGGTAIAALDTVLPGRLGGRLVRAMGFEAAEEVAKRVLLAPVRSQALVTVGRGVVVGMATEGLTEALQEAVGEVAAAGGTSTPVSPELWRQMLEAGAAGALFGGIASGVEAGVEVPLERQQRDAAAAIHQAGVLSSIGASLQGSKTGQLLPEAVESFMRQATQDGPASTLYAPVDTFTTYWQEKGQDPEAIAKVLTGSDRAYAQALRTGEDLVIPMARYATAIAGTEHNAFFANEVRFEPGVMNAREALAFSEQIQAQAAAVSTEPATTPQAERTAEIVAQLERAGLSPDAAAKQAQLYQAFESLGARAGLELRYGITVTRPGLDDSMIGAAPVRPGPITVDDVQALERRTTAGEGPGGVERRASASGDLTPEAILADLTTRGIISAADPNAPINAMADISAAALRMVNEDPTFSARLKDFTERARNVQRGNKKPAVSAVFLAHGPDGPLYNIVGGEKDRSTVGAAGLEELGIAVPETPADTGERLSGDQIRQRMLDARAQAAQTVSDDTGTESDRADTRRGRRPAISRIAESTPLTGRESATARESRRRKHYAAVFSAVRDAAKQLDPGVDVKALRQEFNDRVEMLEQLDDDWRTSEHNPRVLLEAIAEAGGISVDFETKTGGLGGELRWVKDSAQLGPFGAFAGVKGVFRTRQAGARGLATTGLSLDDITRMLNQDPRFNWIEDVNDLFAALEDIARLSEPLAKTVNFPGTEELRRRAGIDPGIDWWKPADEQQFNQGGLFDEDEPAADLLETGEVQPRLPGDVGQVREGETATPELEAPFSLTAEVSKRKGKQETLFQSAFHGSPHEFERFSLHAIGSGEGAQAYGWGLYFASQRETAEYYREQLAGRGKGYKSATFNGRTYPAGTGIGDALFNAKTRGINAAISDLKKAIRFNSDTGYAPDMAALQQTYLDVLMQVDDTEQITLEGTGRVYQVEIPEDEDFLSWDLPASQQSPKVQRALEQLGIEWMPAKVPTPKQALRIFSSARVQREAASDIGIRDTLREGLYLAQQASIGLPDSEAAKAFQLWFGKNQYWMTGKAAIDPTGQSIYQRLEVDANERTGDIRTELQAKARAASQKLASVGIAGIRYLDGFSRSSGAGSSNYVVFDDQLVKITEFYQSAAEQLSLLEGLDVQALTPDELEAEGFDTSRVFYHQTSEANRAAIEAEGFDISKPRARLSDDVVPDGVFLKPTPADIGVGASGTAEDPAAQIPIYVRFGKTQTFANRQQLERRLVQDKQYDELLAASRRFDKEQSKIFDEKWQQLRKLDAENRDERAQHKADLEIDEFLEAWKAGNAERATTARARATELFREEGVETIVIKEDKGSFGRSTETIIAIAGNQLALAEPGKHRVLFQPKDESKRGSIKFGPDREFKIELLEKADLSTFLHESGHLFLEVFGDVADQLRALDVSTLNDQQARVLADYNAALEFLGVENRGQLTREHHEKWARAFEAYLMEGKAPSLELRSAFASFRAWLLGIYRSLRGLNVQLNDQVRQVFDRLLASDEAIAAAEAESNVAPLFVTPEQAGMTPAQFALYAAHVAEASTRAREELQTKLLAEVQRAQQAEWTRRRDEIRIDVQADVYNRPVYMALAAMQKGTYPDGTPIAGEGATPEPMKLSRASLVREFGADRLKRLPRPYIYGRDATLEPSTVAEMFGFSSADEMIRAIEGAQPMKQAIEQEVDRRMIAEQGSILLDGTLQEKANAAVANEARESVIRAELRALAELKRTVAPHVQAAVRAERRERSYERRWLEAEAKLRVAMAEGRKQAEIDALQDEVDNLKRKAAGGPTAIAAAIPPESFIRERAQERIRQTRIADLRPVLFWHAARKASKMATDAAARQDFDAAILAKQQELLNLALFRAATTALEDAEARVKAARDLGRGAARKAIGLAGETYVDQVDSILERYEFKPASGTQLERRASLRRWIASLEGEGLPVDLPEELLDESRRVNYRELTYEELLGVTDGLQHIVHLARLKNRLLKSQEARELNTVAAEIATSVREKTGRRRKAGISTRLPKEERARLVEGFFASHRKMSSLARELDGFEDGGPLWEHVIRPLNEAGDREASMNADATRRMAEIVNRAYPTKDKALLYEKRFIPAIGQSLARMNALMVALNWGNEGNRQRLKSGYKWTDGQVQAILDTLDGRDWRFVQDIWDFLDSYWPAIAEKQERVVGVAPAKVEATPFQTPYGAMRGGYFPLKGDDRLSARAGSLLDLDAANLARQAAYVSATTRRGHTIERVAKASYPVRLDFGVIFEHVNQVIHDLSHHEALLDVGRVLGHKNVQDAIYETHGDIVYKQFKTGVRDVAFGDVPATNAFERSINHLRQGATVAGIGWNLATSLLQPLGLTQSIVRIGGKWVVRGIGRWIRDAAHLENTVRAIEEKSVFMQNRFRTQQREINEIRNRLGVSTGKFTGYVDEVLSKTTFDTVTRQGIADSFFWMIAAAQRIVDVPTWLGAYEKAMDAGKSDADAIAIADQAVLDSQAGGQVKDLAAVQRGGPMMRLWTNFYSFFSTTYNLAAESRRKRRLKHPAEVGRLAADYLMLFIVPASLSYVIKQALSGDDDEQGWIEQLLRANVSYAMGTLLGVRELSGAVSGFDYSGPGGSRFFSTASRLYKQIEQGEPDAAFWRGLNETAGLIFHYPAGQVRRTLEGAVALSEGKTENPGALIVGAPKE